MKPSKPKQTSGQFLKSILSLFCLGFLAASSTVLADWHGKLSLLSEYVYRGYSKSRGNPVLQGKIDYQADAGWIAGVGLSQASFDDREYPDHADLEIKPYLSKRFSIVTDWQAEVAVNGYIYDGKVFGKAADYVEFSGSLHYQDWLSGKISVAPEAYQRQVTVDYELNYRRDIFDTVQVSAGLGFYQAGNLLDKDFFYWNLGVSWFLTSHVVLDFRYVDAQLNDGYTVSSHNGEFHLSPLKNNYLLSISFGF